MDNYKEYHFESTIETSMRWPALMGLGEMIPKVRVAGRLGSAQEEDTLVLSMSSSTGQAGTFVERFGTEWSPDFAAK